MHKFSLQTKKYIFIIVIILTEKNFDLNPEWNPVSLANQDTIQIQEFIFSLEI